VVPTAVRVRQKIAPVVPPTPKARERPVFERKKFDAIMELIDNQCRQFARTPTVFQGMTEEALRNVMLSSLNAVFEGAATGEAFQVRVRQTSVPGAGAEGLRTAVPSTGPLHHLCSHGVASRPFLPSNTRVRLVETDSRHWTPDASGDECYSLGWPPRLARRRLDS